MSKSNVFETAHLLLIFNNTDITLLGDAGGVRGSVAAGSLYMSLHTADPGEAGDQTTSEVAYTGYARVAIARTTGGFAVTSPSGVGTSSTVTNTVFPAGTAGSGTAAFWGLGTSSTGAGKLLYKGAISPSVVCGAGVTPSLTAGSLVTED